jgi:hypothetical protein
MQTLHLFSQCCELGLDRIDVSAVHRTALNTRVMDGNHFLNYLRARPFRRSTRQDNCELVFLPASGSTSQHFSAVKVCRFWSSLGSGAGKRQWQKRYRAACRANVSPIPLTPAIGAWHRPSHIGHNVSSRGVTFRYSPWGITDSRRFVSDFQRAVHPTPIRAYTGRIRTNALSGVPKTV